jgi:C1A family cysteine protease
VRFSPGVDKIVTPCLPGRGVQYFSSARKYLMSSDYVPIILLLLLLCTAGVCASEPPVTISAGSVISTADPVNENGIVVDADRRVPEANTSKIFGAAQINPEFVTYMESLSKEDLNGGEWEYGLGAIPSPLYRPEVTDLAMDDLSVREFNSTFDLRDVGKVSGVRNQRSWGTCWSFASYGSLESYLLPPINRTFSPKNLVNRHGFDPGYNDGGNSHMSTAYLTRWDGPVDEETDPYPDTNWSGSDAFSPVFHVQDVIMLPSRSDRTDTGGIKAAIQRYGAAYISFYWSNVFYNPASSAYYQPAEASDLRPGGGHAVTLVGWNDTFPASAFNVTPPGDGAWILKNSWGSDWGDGGFFYASYYDKYLGSVITPSGESWGTTFFTAEPVNNYQNVYLHDPLGEIRDYYIGEPKNGTVASRYNATEDGLISAVGFYTTDVNTRYRAVLYRNAIDGPLGEEAARFEGNCTWMGYHTVKLPSGSEVPVQAGEYFSVVLTLENQVYDYPVAFEEVIRGFSSNATAQPGESYYYDPDTGSFVDLTAFDPNTSACTRVYTSPVPVAIPTLPPETLSASFTAKPETGKPPLTVRFTDTSSGSPDRWFWNFGDGTQSLDQNPEKTYNQTGSYSVTFVVKKGEETERAAKRNFIRVVNASELKEIPGVRQG